MRVKLAQAGGEAFYVFPIQLGPARRFTFLATGPDLAVRQTFLLGLLQRRRFYQQPLPLDRKSVV